LAQPSVYPSLALLSVAPLAAMLTPLKSRGRALPTHSSKRPKKASRFRLATARFPVRAMSFGRGRWSKRNRSPVARAAPSKSAIPTPAATLSAFAKARLAASSKSSGTGSWSMTLARPVRLLAIIPSSFQNARSTPALKPSL